MSIKDPVEKDLPKTQEYLQQDELPDVVSARKREVALVRKLDCFVAPVMMLLMLISYLDRGNIGFAATQGMTRDIGLKGSQLNVIYFYLTSFRSRQKQDADLYVDCGICFLHLLHHGRGTYSSCLHQSENGSL
jgi:hypothetical protein